ncbi:PREDICTED: beta-galactosidase [Prunus dulcis]|uniref:beta-galactosidase n=1 Tax=Prunus dulcis TaxID=3755 RepID=A0A5E4FU46_PRUDU|nr:PREDICTED: beta-galactosidase [Prunus dulcis]
MKNFTTLTIDMTKKEKLFASQGGPIIIALIENENGNVQSYYGDAGKAYMNRCSNFAQSLYIGVPWIMCQQSDAPQPMISTCNGWYCDNFKPYNDNSLKMWTENWTGWFKSWDDKDHLGLLRILPSLLQGSSRLEALSRTITCIMVEQALVEHQLHTFPQLMIMMLLLMNMVT